MKTLWVLFLMLVAGASTAADKKPDVEVLEATAHRGETKISIEGRIRNTSDKSIKKLTLVFHFMAPGKQVITSQKGQIDEELFEKGQEAAFHMELNGPPR